MLTFIAAVSPTGLPKRAGKQQLRKRQPPPLWRAVARRWWLLLPVVLLVSVCGLASSMLTATSSFPEQPRPPRSLPTTPRHHIGPPRVDSPRAWTPRPMGGRWIVRGVSYDLSEFLDKHPGGRRYLQNTVDTDITELFESMHVGTTAAGVLPRYRDDSIPVLRSRSENNTAFFALKRAIKANFDLDDLKNPSLAYTALSYATLGVYAAALRTALLAPSAAPAWAAHAVLGVAISWLGGFAHNGLHLYPRRVGETLGMYLSLSNNPFRWMYVHLTSHHMQTNTAIDHDKRAVADFQRWWRDNPLMWWVGTLVGVFLAGTRVTWLCADHSTATAPSMTLAEQLVPGVVSIAVLLLGLRCQGARWLPRMLLTIGVASLYAFVFFQVSHVQPETLDGDGIRAAVDDWGEFQLRTTKGWGATRGVLGCAPFLFLNLQPAHHLFPALHHSKLHLVTPLIRQHYPGLMDDQPLLPMVAAMFRIFTADPAPPAPPPARRRECGHAGITVQACEARGCVFDASVPHSPWCYSAPGATRTRGGLVGAGGDAREL